MPVDFSSKDAMALTTSEPAVAAPTKPMTLRDEAAKTIEKVSRIMNNEGMAKLRFHDTNVHRLESKLSELAGKATKGKNRTALQMGEDMKILLAVAKEFSNTDAGQKSYKYNETRELTQGEVVSKVLEKLFSDKLDALCQKIKDEYQETNKENPERAVADFDLSLQMLLRLDEQFSMTHRLAKPIWNRIGLLRDDLGLRPAEAEETPSVDCENTPPQHVHFDLPSSPRLSERSLDPSDSEEPPITAQDQTDEPLMSKEPLKEANGPEDLASNVLLPDDDDSSFVDQVVEEEVGVDADVSASAGLDAGQSSLVRTEVLIGGVLATGTIGGVNYIAPDYFNSTRAYLGDLKDDAVTLVKSALEAGTGLIKRFSAHSGAQTVVAKEVVPGKSIFQSMIDAAGPLWSSAKDVGSKVFQVGREILKQPAVQTGFFATLATVVGLSAAYKIFVTDRSNIESVPDLTGNMTAEQQSTANALKAQIAETTSQIHKMAKQGLDTLEAAEREGKLRSQEADPLKESLEQAAAPLLAAALAARTANGENPSNLSDGAASTGFGSEF